MGRSASGEPKTEYVKIRVKPTLKEAIQIFRNGSKYEDVQEHPDDAGASPQDPEGPPIGANNHDLHHGRADRLPFPRKPDEEV